MAFSTTDFSLDAEITSTMAQLMNDFALALWTTIFAVILKIGVDLFNNFTIANNITKYRNELSRLRILMIDFATQKEL